MRPACSRFEVAFEPDGSEAEAEADGGMPGNPFTAEVRALVSSFRENTMRARSEL